MGTAYDVATFHLGFGAVGEAGKTMGLASYGAPGAFDDVRVYEVERSGGPGRLDVRMNPGFLAWDPGWDALDPAALWARVRAAPSAFGVVREPGDPLPGRPWNDLARHAQRALEDAMVALADDLQRATGCTNLCLAGGVALNCVANRAILERTGFRRLFVQPAASDTGLALGAALAARHLIAGLPRDWVMRDAALGRRPGEDDFAGALAGARQAGLTVGDAGAPGFAPVARLLADGAIVGWVQGGAELGPRALGQRSILMDARVEAHRDVLNGRVKQREGFRPFAPSVLIERAADYFDLPDHSPFMVLVGTATPLARARVPAIVHVDGTARVQTVTDSATPEFARLIRAFDALTGVPMLLNTSFNLAGEPIVDTPADALRTFLATRMDHLVLGRHLVSRRR